ncbi:hypothetical protein ACEQPO_08965 [Bacillus sp. SL00103]
MKVLKEEIISIQDQRTEPGLDELATKKRTIIVELDPPKKLNFENFSSRQRN